MRLLHTTFNESFEETVKAWARDIASENCAALFHVYIPYNDKDNLEKLGRIREVLRKEAFGIPVIGCSATGVIYENQIKDGDYIITAMISEYPDTKISVIAVEEEAETFDASVLLEKIRSIPDIRGIEVLAAASDVRQRRIGMAFDELPEDIVVFGGMAVGDDRQKPFVFSDESLVDNTGFVLVIYSGKELHLQANRMFGWKPIGYPLKVTKSKGPIVYELDGKPAYDVYNHYLHIKKDENFFYNALEFPWEVRVDEDTSYIRHAKSVNEDGSIVMSSPIPQGSDIRLTYGDPRRIIDHTKQTVRMICEFAPQVVSIVNCLGRKLFWRDNDDVEVSLISNCMQSTGFSALGEILRYKGVTVLNNLSIVTVAMREGPAGNTAEIDLEEFERADNMPITARLAIFINTITEELMEKNEQLNDMLYKVSHDALTGLLNRGAIERMIYESKDLVSQKPTDDWFLIMFDVDDFKMINDQCGHVQGDSILQCIAFVLFDYMATIPNAEAGRWGGEEFMVVAFNCDEEKAKEIADTIRERVKEESKNVTEVTISVGVTKHHRNEEVTDTINRVDELMYEAKVLGKDRVCSDL